MPTISFIFKSTQLRFSILPLKTSLSRPIAARSMATITTTSTPRVIRKFAPLNQDTKSDLPRLKAVVFDVDGTLCHPQTWMFQQMRNALGITKGTDILDHVHSLPEGPQEEAFEKIRNVERLAMKEMVPQEGLKDLMDYLDERGVKKAICTRNFDAPVNHLITTFITGHLFEPIVTRDFKPPKPAPDGILHIAKELGFEDGGEGLIMVGDSLDDMTAGRRAGAATVLLANDVNQELREHEHTDLIVTKLPELIKILEDGFVSREVAES